MVVIAVANIPQKVNLKKVVKMLAPTVHGHFEALNFIHTKNCSTVFLRLAEKLDHNAVIARLNKKMIKSKYLHAYIPNNLPNLPVSHKPWTIPSKMRRDLNLPANLSQDQLIRTSMESIMREMQTKFTGLYNLSMATGHTLLDNIGKVIHYRLCVIVKSNNDEDNCFKLTKAYRRRHPHSGDFPLITASLHAIQDKEGKPHSVIEEKELLAVNMTGFKDLPMEILQPICNSHITRISKKLVEHINELDVADETSTPEEAAQKNVRKHLKSLVPHIPTYVRQVITNHFMPSEQNFYLVKCYGEPFLPGKEIMMPFTKKYHVKSTIRAENMYNLISLKVPATMHLQLLKADGTMLSGAKLVIRPAHLPLYKLTRYLRTDDVVEDPLSKPKESTVPTVPKDEQEDATQEDNTELEWSDSW